MDCRTIAVNKFKNKLGFKQCDVILTKEQSVLTKIKSLFGGEHFQKLEKKNCKRYIDLYSSF